MDIPTLIVKYEDRNEFDQVVRDYDFRNHVFISKVFNSWLKQGRAGQSMLSFYHSNSGLITGDFLKQIV